MSLSTRAVLAPLVTAATVAALVFGTGAISASAIAPATVTGTLSEPVLTLPYNDGFNDTQTLTITSTTSDDVTVSSNAFPDQDVALTTDNSDGTFSGTLDIGALKPAAGTYDTTLTQDEVATDGPQVVVGSGQATDVSVDVADGPFYVNGSSTGFVSGTISATDETGTQLPIHSATWDLTDSAGTHTTGATDLNTAGTPTSVAFGPTSVSGWSIGDATLEASNVTGPDTTFAGDSSTSVPLVDSFSFLGVHLSRNVSTVYPVKDGFRDTVTFTVSPAKADADDSSYEYTGAVVIKHGSTTVKSLPFSGSTGSSVVWDGLTSGKLVTGTFTAVATMTVPGDGKTLQSVPYTVVVSSERLHAHTTSVTVNASSYFSNAHNSAFESSTKGAATYVTKAAAKNRIASGSGSCATHSIYLYCTTTNGGVAGRIGYLTTPAKVVASTKYHSFSSHMYFTVTKYTHTSTSGGVYLWGGYEKEGGEGTLKSGTIATKTESFGAGNGIMVSIFEIANKVTLHVSKVKADFTYYTLS